MGDAHDGFVQLGLDADQLVLEFLASDRVNRTERLVHEQHRRIRSQGARHPHALLLSARQFLRVTVSVQIWVQGNEFQQLIDTFGDTLLVPAQHLGHHGDIRADGQVRQQTTRLDHIPDATAKFIPIHVGYVLAVDHNFALGGFDQAVDHFQRGGFAAPRAANKHHHRACWDFQGQLVHCGLLSSAFLTAVTLGYVVNQNCGAAFLGTCYFGYCVVC